MNEDHKDCGGEEKVSPEEFEESWRYATWGLAGRSSSRKRGRTLFITGVYLYKVNREEREGERNKKRRWARVREREKERKMNSGCYARFN